MRVTASTKRKAVEFLADQKNRLNSLYYITNENGERVRFQMNMAQERFYDAQHDLDLLLKARQLGFTTLIQLIMLDTCLFRANTRAGVIAHNRDDASAFFKDKIKFAYDNLPDGLKQAVSAEEDSAFSLAFSNNSSIRVGTSLRSGTLQMLHVSEYGKLCARFPDKAAEVKTGALNTVHAGQKIWIESTAEGQEGDFYDKCQDAQALMRKGGKLTPLDFKFHFYGWWMRPEYRMEADGVPIPEDMAEYFVKLEEQGVTLDAEQRAWYVKKAAQQGEHMRREFPSTPEEAFEAAIEGAYYGQQMAKAEQDGRIGRVPHAPALRVHTSWDLGVGDAMVIWFYQLHGKERRYIDYYENSGEGLAHYAHVLQDKARPEAQGGRGFLYGTPNAPHDVEVKEMGTGKTRFETARNLGINFNVVKRTESVNDDIEAVRNALPFCWFDEENCAVGIKHMKAYRKEWNDRLGVWRNEPRHDEASHAADGFRTGIMAKAADLPDNWGKPMSPKLGTIA